MIRELLNRTMNEQLAAWVVIAYPDPSWAERMFGEPDVDRLFEEIAHACRLHDDDPVASWKEHLDALERRRTLLDERRFDRVHFRGPGTDLTVGLMEQSRWLGGYSRTAWGQVFCANVPTEEVFTTPHRLRTEGTVRGTRAVSYDEGVLVDGIELRFDAGRDRRSAARRSATTSCARHLDAYENARYLGECALVAGSRIGERGLLFYNTLFDENATSHIAYGMGYVEPVAGASALDAARAERARPQPVARAHGLPDRRPRRRGATGSTRAGERVPILAGDEWLLA